MRPQYLQIQRSSQKPEHETAWVPHEAAKKGLIGSEQGLDRGVHECSQRVTCCYMAKEATPFRLLLVTGQICSPVGETCFDRHSIEGSGLFNHEAA